MERLSHPLNPQPTHSPPRRRLARDGHQINMYRNYKERDFLPGRILLSSTPCLDGCWKWNLSLDRDGYGITTIKRVAKRAHKVAYEVFIGPVPEGLVLDHKCRVRHCVNPWHLEPVTNKENVMRGKGACALNARRTHCINGHEYSAENTAVRNGVRNCLTCERIKTIEYRARKRAEKHQADVTTRPL